MAVIYTEHFVQFFDDSGNPLSNGKLYAYSAGTTTPKATYTTEEATVEHAHPIVLDSAGRATVFIEGSYRFDLFDQNDVLIKSTDDVTSFTTLNEEGEPFFQSFSGDASQTVFTLSESLGDDSKDIIVFVDNDGREYVDNGDFATDTVWTKGSGWSIGSGVATATTASTALEQDAPFTISEGVLYTITYTITRSAGSVTPSIGGTDGTSRNAAGTYTESILAGSTQVIAFTGSGFSGTVDNVSVNITNGKGYEIQSPNAYTLNLTSLTFNVAPSTGTDNVYVIAPTKLLGAASAAAAAAAASEASAATSATSAATSATSAAASATKLEGTSSTSVAIATGSKSFTTQADKFFDEGTWLLITSDADETNYMHGQVTSYSGTALTVNVTNVGGSGTLADWTIRVSGTQGATGDTGSVSATSAVVAATSGGASLQANNNANCASWGAGGGQNFTVTNTLSFSAGGANVDIIRDEDDMVSDDANALATQQSIKAYVDSLSRYELIATYTPSAASTLDITDLSAYKHVLIVFDLTVSTDAASISLRTSTDNGSTFTSAANSYAYKQFNKNASAAGSSSNEDNGTATSVLINNNVGNAAGEGIQGFIELVAMNDASVKTMIYAVVNTQAASANYIASESNGWRTTAEDNDAVQIFPSGGTITGNAYVYGI